jgi:uncharacterized RDD family membrane protein YckC
MRGMIEPGQETHVEGACPGCGHVNVDAKFCDRCGTRLPVPIACASCGHVNVDAKFCDRCGKALGDALNPYAAPADEIGSGAAVGGDRPLASRGSRLAAAIIDGLCVSIVNVPVLMAAGLLRFDGTSLPLSRTVLAAGLGFIVFTIVQGLFLLSGQTIGKRLLGLRMVDVQSGEPAPIGRLLGMRYLPLSLASLIPIVGPFLGLVDALFIFRGDRRCFHDHLASTRVIADR